MMQERSLLTGTAMVAKLAKLPRRIHGLLLVVSLLGVTLVTFPMISEQLGSLPIDAVPAKYWLYLGLGQIFLLGFTVSLHFLINTFRSLSLSIASIGFIGAFNLVVQFPSKGWTGNMAAFAIGTVLFFAVALAEWNGEREANKHSKPQPD